MLLSDIKDGPAPLDPFKTVFNKLERKLDVVEKVNHTNFSKPKNEDLLNAEHEGPGIK